MSSTPSSSPNSQGLADDGLLPDLTGQITRQEIYPSAHGGFSDIWIGHWNTGHPNCTLKVAVKVLRSQTHDELEKIKMNKRLRRELRVWRGLSHEHIVPLYGVVSDFGPYTSMVCPWMENGNMNKYLECSGTTLTLSIRFRLLSEVAAGLSYLHSSNIVHGDLTGANILISSEGKACLSDFGLSTIIADFQGTSYFTSTIHGNLRWSAPELFRIDSAPAVSTHSDIYSFGSVMLQILSGRVPYHELKSEVQVLISILPPLRTIYAYWCFIRRCWIENPRDRPTISEVLEEVQFFRSTCHQNNSTFNINPDRLFSSDAEVHTRFTGQPPSYTLPSSAGSSSKVQTQRSTFVTQWAVPPRVLLVDDDAVIRKLSIKLLQVFGCMTDVAVDGIGAVDKMNLQRYDLVLMDIMMPRLDGISATTLIRKFDLMTPIISMTSNSKDNEIQTYYTSGMNDILPKPFGKESLLDILEKHLMHLKVIRAMARVPCSITLTPVLDCPLQQTSASRDVLRNMASDERTLDADDKHIKPLSGLGLTDEQYNSILQYMGVAGATTSAGMGIKEQASPPSVPPRAGRGMWRKVASILRISKKC